MLLTFISKKITSLIYELKALDGALEKAPPANTPCKRKKNPEGGTI